jgi:Tfp pilus assembly protein PilX
MIRRTRGFLLLPVALTLVAVGALAYAMTRDAGMSINRVDAAYDTEVARYLAESAVNLARWNNNKTNCSNQPATFTPTQLYRYSVSKGNIGTTAADLVGTMTLNAISVVGNNSNGDKNSITVDVSSATTATPAGSQRIVRTVYRYNLTNPRTATISGNGAGANTTISTTNATPQGTMAYMELADIGAGNQSYGLLRFNLTALPRNALVKDATLRLKYFDGDTFPIYLTRRLDIYRVTSTWDPATAVWTLPWSKPGGDYAASPVTGSPVDVVRYYTWRIDALVAGWVDGTIANNGVLLKPTDLPKSRFGAFTSGDADGPQLTVNYYERCN